MNEPEFAFRLEQINAAAAKVAEAIHELRYVSAAQAVTGWMVRGDFERAREALERIPSDRLSHFAEYGEALPILIAEETARRTPSA